MRRLYRFYLTADRFGLVPNVSGVLLGLLLAYMAVSHGAEGLSQAIEQGVRQACSQVRR